MHLKHFVKALEALGVNVETPNETKPPEWLLEPAHNWSPEANFDLLRNPEGQGWIITIDSAHVGADGPRRDVFDASFAEEV